jgi:hypothetical protein
VTILSNQVHCVRCGDEPYSANRHDFRPCQCGAVSVDGGQDYLRRLGSHDDYVEMSVAIDEHHVEELKGIIEDKTRNSFGKVCWIARYLRDEMNINIGEA